MFLKTLLYIIAFLLVWYIWVVFLQSPMSASGLLKRVFDKKYTESKFVNRLRKNRLFHIYLILGPVIAFPFSYMTLVGIGYMPPFLSPSRYVLIDETRPNVRMEALRTQSKSLTEALASMDDLTVNEIRDVLSKAIAFLDNLEREARVQEHMISSLRETVSEEQSRADTARRVAKSLASLSQEQLEAIKLVITTDARAQSNAGFWIGVATSLPIGIATSLSAAWIWYYMLRKRTGKRKPNKTFESDK